MQFLPIGTLHTPFKQLSEMPIQPSGARGIRGQLVLRPELTEGLKDLAGFSHLILIYQFHRAGSCQLQVTPFLDHQPRGIFATRAPTRPNPIGLSVVKLIAIEGHVLDLEDVDVLDGTPVLDIKPYVPEFDQPNEVHTGWLQQAAQIAASTRSDRRFTNLKDDNNE